MHDAGASDGVKDFGALTGAPITPVYFIVCPRFTHGLFPSEPV